MRHFKSLIVITSVTLLLLFGLTACKESSPEESDSSDSASVTAADQSVGTLYNTGLDTGYSNQDPVGEDDIHYGWKMGEFSFGGYADIDESDKNKIKLSQNDGEKVRMYFNLKQNITELNGSKKLSVNKDINGYDEQLNVKDGEFGFGTLIIKRVNPRNSAEKPTIFVNFLSDIAKVNQDVIVHEFDEGDYDVSLDYEIVNTENKAQYSNYKIAFRITVGSGSENTPAPENTQKYRLGSFTKTKSESGYSRYEAMKDDDPHYGWELGYFYVEGFTSCRTDDQGQIIVLKNEGDTVKLMFHLDQDIAKLNNVEGLSISDDESDSDTYFQNKKEPFKHGALLFKKTDYQNKSDSCELVTDYLKIIADPKGDDTILLCEEGDYEVALDYKIKDQRNNKESYHNYRIFFKFSVRNGNCMFFLNEVGTDSELLDNAVTKNGFYLNLVKSRYLDIDIKKSMLIEGSDYLTEDTRFNRPAKDKDEFTEEGVYTITAHNRYTNVEPTIKTIYVGDDPILKSHFITGYPIKRIRLMLELGAQINDDGTISMPESSQSGGSTGA